MKIPQVICLLLQCAGLSFNATAQNTITTVAGTGAPGYLGDGGQATNAHLTNPGKVFADASGDFYFTDMLYNHVVRKVSATTGIITTVVGDGTSGNSGDGGPASAARIYWPGGVCKDATGNLYITDAYSNVVRKVDAATGNISSIAGTGTDGYSGDGGPATNANLSGPMGICADAAGNIFFTEDGNGTVRKINAASGTITTIAGTGTNGFSGDGGAATTAQLDHPDGIVVSSTGELFVADVRSRRIRKIGSSGVISTVAGNGSAGYTGDGGAATAATLFNPSDVSVDNMGNLYIADLSNNVIRRVNTMGIISTYAGTGTGAYSGDGGPATDAQLNTPSGVSFSSGALYIADGSNDVIRKVTINTTGVKQMANTAAVDIYPNPFNDKLIIDGAEVKSVEIRTIDARLVAKMTPKNTGKTEVNTASLTPGTYMLTVQYTNANQATSTIIVKQAQP